MLDDATGFMSHATQTRVNRVAITDEETIVLGLQIAAQGGIQNTLKLVDAAAGIGVLGLNSTTALCVTPRQSSGRRIRCCPRAHKGSAIAIEAHSAPCDNLRRASMPAVPFVALRPQCVR